MHAAVYRGPRSLSVDEVPVPSPGPGEVLVEVGFNGICGTDLHEYFAGPIFVPDGEPHPLTGKAMPLVMGHEFSGTVRDLGAGVAGWSEGDRVAIEPVYRCGECAPCRAGHYNICQKIGFHGLMSDGGMARFTTVPDYMLHRLPDSVSLELGALVEPMSVAYHATTLADLHPGDTALVFGAGPIGIGVFQALRGQGIEKTLIVEPSETRRAAVERLGARTVDPTTVDVAELVADETSGAMADAAFDAAGVAAAVDTAISSVGARRPTVAVAIYERPLEAQLLQLVMHESRIQGSLCYTGSDFEAVIALMADGGYDTTGWVEAIALGDVVDGGFEALHRGEKMKVLVDPSR
ncbi:2,3-butanediol dehydrogenase [Tsukamurella sp. 8F]|uniref:2,3-butanediol dehydrogenase n=1 Tax=unclassified Tsukamurella TaxID=2633480 RepID=UPI0023B9AE5C|nr:MULTISPECIES: 2,3-butanediol dehydrogenase [unclassified Tsukamurella]MDF0531875.1 2,3-butanediol dehydrogenase [Tsukamurella sp. 8J]MDF0589109.1 2,3-butanediol dehydrogenase [Tsukamurella sp. 8F]